MFHVFITCTLSPISLSLANGKSTFNKDMIDSDRFTCDIFTSWIFRKIDTAQTPSKCVWGLFKHAADDRLKPFNQVELLEQIIGIYY